MTGEPATYSTVIELCRDVSALRLKITAFQPSDTLASSSSPTVDDIQKHDYVAAAFSFDSNAKESYIFFVDPTGHHGALSSVTHYAPSWSASCSRGNGKWTCDVSIPYDAFTGVDRKKAALPRIAFMRHMQRDSIGYWYWPNVHPTKPLDPSSEASLKQLFP